MTSSSPRIAIPEPSTTDRAYSQRSWPVYAKAIARAGGIPVAVPLEESQSTMARIVNSCQAILLPGSPADVDPEKYGRERIRECGPKDALRESADDLLLQDAFNLYKPILAICYGVQSLNVWRNGTLIQHLPGPPPGHLKGTDSWNPSEIQVNHSPGRELRKAHSIALAPDSKLAEIVAAASDLEQADSILRLTVNSSHHQAIEHPGDQLRVVAQSPEDGVIEAVEGQNREQFVLGIQWHPERSYDQSEASRAMFAAFVDAAKEWRPRAVTDSVHP